MRSAENRPSTASITCSATVRPNRASHARGIGPVFSIVPSVRFPGAAGTPSMLRTVQRIQLIPLETATRKGADTLNVRYQNNRITFKITDWTTREAVSKLKTGNTSRTTELAPREEAHCAQRMLKTPVDDPRWTNGDVRTWSTEAKKLGVTLELEIGALSDEEVTARGCGRDHKTGAIRVFDIDAHRALRPERTPNGLATTQIWVDGGLSRSQYSIDNDGLLRWKVYRISCNGKRKKGVDLTLAPGTHEQGCLRWTSALPVNETGPAQALPVP